MNVVVDEINIDYGISSETAQLAVVEAAVTSLVHEIEMLR